MITPLKHDNMPIAKQILAESCSKHIDALHPTSTVCHEHDYTGLGLG